MFEVTQMEKMIQDPINYAKDVVGKDPLATFLGIEVEDVRHGYARCGLTVKPEYLNAVERAHGGIIHAVADQAFAVASNSMGTMAVALTMNLQYLQAAIDGERLFAECMLVHAGRKISSWRIEVRGNNDAMIAIGDAVAYHK